MMSFFLSAGCAPIIKTPGADRIEPRLDAQAIVTADDERLPLRVWMPPDGVPLKAVVVAVHGLNDYSHAFEGPGIYLSAKGIGVYAYDQRGFGQGPWPGYWAGGEAMVADFATALRLVAARYPGIPLYAMGESMGGAVAILTMTGDNPPPVAGVILSAPAVWGRDDMTILERGALWLTWHVAPWMTFSGSGLNVRPSDNIEMLRALGRDPLVIKKTRADVIHGLVDLMSAAQRAAGRLSVPVLMLYGEHDEVVPREPVLRVMAELHGDAQVKALYANGWHILMRDLQAEVVMADIAAWIENRRLPSGADDRAARVLSDNPR